MVDALAAKANVTSRMKRRKRSNGAAGFRVRVGGDWMEADHVIVACPAWAAARGAARRRWRAGVSCWR